MILQDKVVLVTGGTSGIGRATAIAFGAAGAKVVFSDIRSVEGEETADLIRNTGAGGVLDLVFGSQTNMPNS